METYEKLGAFFLGRTVDSAAEGEADGGLLLYDAKDLTTHAVCVGMTGSGKTGLCLSLLEEAALDGIPAIAIDPKGDLGNLLLTFPELDGESFLPWVDTDAARRKGMSRAAYAEAQAELWRSGLAKWQQSGERIARLRAAAEFAIYTPGSRAGIPISILSSFTAPGAAIVEDADLYRDRVATTVTSLLTLLGVEADPIQSPEHILLSTILDHYWQLGQDLDLGSLIQALQNPPVEKVGVLELDAFFPAPKRFELAMRINNLMAAPGFQGWLEGQPMAIDRLLYTPEGKPRIAIVSIAHLGESERMFFVSLLLNEVLGWIRTRPGTDSLRALLYLDEVFGFMPPVAEPPSKRPLLTLLKQARAYGLGVVLATQNPVDLDYKGLSNTGTWFLGRLQTERDKLRVLDGLEGAAVSGGGFDRQAMEQTLAGLGKRVFLMHNVHEPEPVLFQTRWAMSYLRGPLTRTQIQELMRDRPRAEESDRPAAAEQSVTEAPSGDRDDERREERPVLPPDVAERFLPVRQYTSALRYRGAVLGLASVHFTDRKRTVEADEQVALALPVDGDRLHDSWDGGQPIDVTPSDLAEEPAGEAAFDELPPGTVNAKRLKSCEKSLADHLYHSRTLELWKSPSLDLRSEPGESEQAFRIRMAEGAREDRDRQTEALRDRFAVRLQKLEERLRKAQSKVDLERQQASSQKLQSVISVGTALLSAFLGRKRLSSTTLSKAGTAAKGMSRAGKEAQDVRIAEENVERLQEELRQMESQLEEEIDDMRERLDPLREPLETVVLRPRRTDVRVRLVALGWLPYEARAEGERWLYQRSTQ